MEINAIDRIAVNRFAYRNCAAFARVKLLLELGQWISPRGPACPLVGRVARHSRGGFPMIEGWKNRVARFASLLLTLGALAAFAGCESKGPAEKAGESIDKGVQNAKDAVNPPGAGEKAGREVDKALKP